MRPLSSGHAQTVFFHIGVPKSGTTYIQQSLRRNREALRTAGVLYPGKGDSHFRPCQDLLGWSIGGQEKTRTAGAWQHLVEQVEQWQGPAVIDHELFCGARPEIVDRALSDLAFAEVHVVLTARDFARQLPAVWQTRLRTGAGGTYASFLNAVVSGPPGGGTSLPFWRNQDVSAILQRWGRSLPMDHVHVVTVPPVGSDPDLLWQRFTGVLGIDPTTFPSAPRGANTSLGAAEAAVLVKVNEAAAEQNLPWHRYVPFFKQRLAPVLARRDSPAIELPEDVYRWSVDWSEVVVAKLQSAGYDIAGDLTDLVPRDRPTGANPDTVTAADQLDALVAGMLSMAASRPRKTAEPEPPPQPRVVRFADKLARVASRLRRN